MSDLSSGKHSIDHEQLGRQLGVYLVTDERPDLGSLLDVIRKALAGGTTTVQLRRKHDDGRALVELGRAIRAATREHGALYIVNDRVDVALLTDADGVHVGQSDIACMDVRRLIGWDKVVGVSATTVHEAEGALRDGADYLGAGSVFPTASKSDAEMCGLPGLHEIAQVAAAWKRQVRPVPVAAIGGITETNAAEVLAAGAHGLAVVSAIMQAPDPAAASAALAGLVRQAAAR